MEYLDYNGLERYHELSQKILEEKELVTSAALNDLESSKQDVIDSSNKLSADLVDDTSSTNKFVTTSDKLTWNNKIDKAVNDLTNYYLKSETYTQAEVDTLIGNIQHFHYEIYASTSAVTSPAGNVLYLIGPTGTGNDQYEEYVYTNSIFVKIGDITVDLSDYYTKTQVDNKFVVGDANGHDYVDLGLPSGTLWATMNVGANSETDYGNYYMYGKGTTQYNSSDTPYTGTEDPLDLSVDTARQEWGGSWHMPTRAQMQELKANTTYQWVTNYKGSGINGGTFTATNGAVLFIPAAGSWYNGSQYEVGDYGYYWGSSPDGSSCACRLYFFDGSEDVYDDFRENGYSVRPVLNKTEKYATKTELATKQDVIDSSHKLSADLVDDANTTNKFTNATEKQTWNGKQDALTFNTAYDATTNKVATMADINNAGFVTETVLENKELVISSALNDLEDRKQDALTFNTAYDATTNKVATMADVPDVTGKADKINNATSGNFATLDSNGNLTDSGHKHSDYLTSHQDISGKEDVTTIVAPVNATDATLPVTSLTCEIGKYYRLDVPVETLAVTLPAMAANVTTTKTVLIYLTGGTTPAITISSTAVSGGTAPDVYYQYGFEIEAGKTYEINALFNGAAWIVAGVKIVVPEVEEEEGGE